MFVLITSHIHSHLQWQVRIQSLGVFLHVPRWNIDEFSCIKIQTSKHARSNVNQLPESLKFFLQILKIAENLTESKSSTQLRNLDFLLLTRCLRYYFHARFVSNVSFVIQAITHAWSHSCMKKEYKLQVWRKKDYVIAAVRWTYLISINCLDIFLLFTKKNFQLHQHKMDFKILHSCLHQPLITRLSRLKFLFVWGLDWPGDAKVLIQNQIYKLLW